MKEILAIIKAYTDAREQGRQTALATVVHVEGSSYRRPGARMLIEDNGELTGAISGGCLEGDALRKALLVMHQQKPMLVTYDTMDEDDAVIGAGLGCNGIIQVLIEPISDQSAVNPIKLLELVTAKRQTAVLVTLFSLEQRKDPQQGTCLLVTNEAVTGQTDNGILQDFIIADARQAMVEAHAFFKNYLDGQKNQTAFIEYIKPAVSLIIVGAGNDVVPLTAMAAILGWQCIIADGRANYLTPNRFTAGCQLLLAKPEQLLSKIHVDDQSIFLLMTHNYNYDKAMLKEILLHTPALFVGMLGPVKKLDRMLTELETEGTVFTTGQQSKIHSPVGLDIGAETPEEIALSIIAEIQGALTNKNGAPLRTQGSVIHARSFNTIEAVTIPSKS